MIVGRRSILKGLIALVAAPAIVKVSSLMPVNAALQPDHMLANQFTMDGARLGSVIRIRLPRDFVVSDGPGLALADIVDRETFYTLRSVNLMLNAPALGSVSLPS